MKRYRSINDGGTRQTSRGTARAGEKAEAIQTDWTRECDLGELVSSKEKKEEESVEEDVNLKRPDEGQ